MDRLLTLSDSSQGGIEMSIRALIIAAAVALAFLLAFWLRRSTRRRLGSTSFGAEDLTIYEVGINEEHQYSIWPTGTELPPGWKSVGKSGTKQECLDYLEEVWVDLRPLSQRKSSDQRTPNSTVVPTGEYRLNLQLLEVAYNEGEIDAGDKILSFHVHPVADLVLPSGLVAATDPLVFPEMAPFTQNVPVGKHPVDLAVAVFPGGDERVAFARVRFSQETPVAWRMAVLEGQDPASLSPGEIFGYGVDAGTGCFMDPETSRALTARINGEPDYCERIMDELLETYRNTWSWAVLEPDPHRDLNLVAFSSGWGDGLYPSSFGYDQQNRVVCLVTDFGVIPEAEPEQLTGVS